MKHSGTLQEHSRLILCKLSMLKQFPKSSKIFKALLSSLVKIITEAELGLISHEQDCVLLVIYRRGRKRSNFQECCSGTNCIYIFKISTSTIKHEFLQEFHIHQITQTSAVLKTVLRLQLTLKSLCSKETSPILQM